VLRAVGAPAVDLRSRAERAHVADLYVVAALVLAGDETLDRDAVRERLLELTRDVAATAGDALQHDRPRAAAVVHDRRLDLVSLVELNLARLRIAELAEVDRRLGLAADGDEGGRRANRDHPPADDVPGCDPPLALAPLLARREKRGKVLLVVGRRHGFALLYPATRRDAIRACCSAPARKDRQRHGRDAGRRFR